MKWKTAPLKDVAKIVRNSIQASRIENKSLYLGLENIDSNGICSPIQISNGKLKSNKFTFTDSDILYGKLRPYLNKIAVPNFSGICSTDIIPIHPNSNIIDKRYLFRFLRTPEMIEYATSRCSGVNLPRISPKLIEEFQIPLPPLPIQQKIAAILDAADAYRQKTKALIEKYDQLTQSLFLEMFGDPVRNEKGWETSTIEQLVKNEKYSIKRGPFGGSLKKEIFVEDGYLVYEQHHALNNDFEFGRYFIDRKKFDELSAFEVKPEDIIISCSGVYLGKLAIVPVGAKQGIINQALLKISLNQEKMDNILFTFIFRNRNFRDTFFGTNRGSGIPNFPPMSRFKEFTFIQPPINLQKDFTEKVRLIRIQLDLTRKANGKAEELFQSLLQRAFKGELHG